MEQNEPGSVTAVQSASIEQGEQMLVAPLPQTVAPVVVVVWQKQSKLPLH